MDDDITDDERDNRGSVDPTGYAGDEARAKSRSCRHCSGHGFKTIFDFDYKGSSIIQGIDDYGDIRKRVGRTVSYCVCLFGRWIMENHKKTAKDVYGRIPDFADIRGQSSFWLEVDPTYRDMAPSEIPHEGLRRMLAQRINARANQSDV